MTAYTGKPMTQWQFASLGGRARAKKLSKKRRIEISKKANKAKRDKKMAKNKGKSYPQE